MDRLKKLNGSMIAAIVLSVLLIMSVTAGATLAWFASRDNATNTLTMGEAVVVTIGEDYKQGDGSLAMTLPVDPTTGGLLPGMAITPNVRVHLQESNTNALLRARFITTVEYPQNYMDAAYEDTNKYPNSASFTTGTGKVLDDEVIYLSPSHPDYVTEAEAAVLNEGKQESEKKTGGPTGTYNIARTNVYNVYAGYIDYTYYDYLGEVDDAKSKEDVYLARVEVRKEIVNAKGSTYNIGGIDVTVSDDNMAALEIRQRGIDLTNAINRVLAGQRGFGIDPEDGSIVDDTRVGVKYSRRIADGWAYRDADQCWYYMGSQTNGFTFTADANASYTPAVDKYASEDALIDDSKPAARDITAYTATPVGNVTVQRPKYEVWDYDEGDITSEGGTRRGTGDKSRNYLGGHSYDDALNRYDNEVAVLNNESIASVDLSQGNVQIDFLTKRFVLPTFINNNYAKAQVSFSFTVEAIQDYLIDPLQEATSAADRVPNNLVNAIMVFNNAFPQNLVAGGSEEALANMGTVANIIPGGGTSVSWDQATGTATVKYGTDNLVGISEDKLTPLTKATGASTFSYSYGYIADVTAEGIDIMGFASKPDEYGDVVADYTEAAAWQRGTASSLGVNPAGSLE